MPKGDCSGPRRHSENRREQCGEDHRDTISKIRGGPLQHNMVRRGLFLQAELDGVTDVCPIDTADDPYFYTFKVQCGSCREVNANWVDISRQVPPTSTNADLLIVSGEGQYQRK